MYRRTSLVSGISAHARPAVQYDWQPTLVTPSGHHLAQAHAFSFGEAPTTTPLSHQSPMSLRSSGHSVHETQTCSSALPAHVRSYVQELRRKRHDFDARRQQLTQQKPRAATSSVSSTYHLAASAVPLPPPISSNDRRAEAQRRTTQRFNQNPTGAAQRASNLMYNNDVSRSEQAKRVQQLEIMLHERDSTTIKLQLRVQELENVRVTLERQTSTFLQEKERNISTLLQKLDVTARERREERQSHSAHIQTLQSKNDMLKVQLLALKTSPMATLSPNSWTRTVDDVVRSNNVVLDQADQADLVVQLKLAVEALELRNFKLKQDLLSLSQSERASSAMQNSAEQQEMPRAMQITQEQVERLQLENIALKHQHGDLEKEQLQLLKASSVDANTIEKLTQRVLQNRS
jgi:hypothetical protein